MKESSMNAALRGRCEMIRELLARADLDEIETRYKIGAIVARVRDEKGTYGERAVENLAAELKKSAATLYRYASVADLVPWRELRSIAKMPDCNADTLSWKHCEQLARAGSGWKPWHARVLAEGWSARRLETEIDACRNLATDASVEDTTEKALRSAIDGILRFGGEVASSFEALVDRIERAPRSEQSSAAVAALLSKAQESLGEAATKTNQLLLRLQRLTSRPPQEIFSPGRTSRR
jgi:hypothetical protein